MDEKVEPGIVGLSERVMNPDGLRVLSYGPPPVVIARCKACNGWGKEGMFVCRACGGAGHVLVK